jgi:hypothetical protein
MRSHAHTAAVAALTALTALTLALTACSGSQGAPPTQPGNGGQAAGPAPGPPPPLPAGGDIEVRAPVLVQITQAASNPATGESDISVWIDVTMALQYPATLAAHAPPGGAIVMGVAQDTLSLGQVGRQVRTFRVKTAGPLTAEAPFQVVVHGEAPNKGSGFHVDKKFPAATGASPPAPGGPSAPGGRPPGAPGARPPGAISPPHG